MRKINEKFKKLIVGCMLFIFSFLLFSPPIYALDYDPFKPNIGDVINITGDDDPFGVDKVNERHSINIIPYNFLNIITIYFNFENSKIYRDIEKNEYRQNKTTSSRKKIQRRYIDN
ncbi:MAG: hypothetical protein DWP97_08725 [Calditrichaeota bacterium]|nr:MAG: hypothetical protein DWP97_08725 [Calditrichota bacterium]